MDWIINDQNSDSNPKKNNVGSFREHGNIRNNESVSCTLMAQTNCTTESGLGNYWSVVEFLNIRQWQG